MTPRQKLSKLLSNQTMLEGKELNQFLDNLKEYIRQTAFEMIKANLRLELFGNYNGCISWGKCCLKSADYKDSTDIKNVPNEVDRDSLEDTFIQIMKAIQDDPGDLATVHASADAELCNLLRRLGYEKVVKEYEKIDKVYG